MRRTRENGDQQATVAFWHEWSDAEREHFGLIGDGPRP